MYNRLYNSYMAASKKAWSVTAFVIPCFNDAESAIEVISSLPRESIKVLVDDGSLESFEKHESIFPFHENTYLLSHCINLGQGAAIETGFEFLRRFQKRVDFVFTFDSDGQHSFADSDSMLQSMIENPCNVILGSRFLHNVGMKNFEGGLFKYHLLTFASKLARLTFGIKVTDRHNGLRLMEYRVLGLLSLRINGYGHADEFLSLIQNHGLSFREHPVTIHYDRNRKGGGQPTLNAFKIVFDSFWRG
jgi:glycosyltransferase involved in cell wall biosynthesis